MESSSSSLDDDFICIFFVSVWCLSRRWFDFTMFVLVVVMGTTKMISICVDRFRRKKKITSSSSSFAFAFWSLNWVSLWCVSSCLFDLTMYVIFVFMVTPSMMSICTDLFIIKKKERRETMRGLLSNRIDKDKLKPGDHIYTWRHGWIYAHHGVYCRDGKVIHLTRGGGHKFDTRTTLDPSPSHSKNNPMNPCPTCGYQLNRGGVRVISSCMECFLSGGNLYLFHYDVSVVFFLAKLRGGTCTLAPSDPPEKVLDRAESLLSKDRNTKIRNGFADYDLFHNNCEDFAIYCKTGPRVCFDIHPNTYVKMGVRHTMRVRSSGQVVCLLAAAIVVMGSLVLGFPGAIMGFGNFFLERLYSDVGRRLAWDKQVLHERFVSPSVLEDLEAMADVANESKSLWRGPELLVYE